MPKYRVDIQTNLPSTGYVIVEADSVLGAQQIVKELIADLDLTALDDRIAFSNNDELSDPTVLRAQLANDDEAIAAAINETREQERSKSCRK